MELVGLPIAIILIIACTALFLGWLLLPFILISYLKSVDAKLDVVIKLLKRMG